MMFITLLLAAGTLALEREENAFPRLVRGLVSRTGAAAGEGGPGGRLLAGGVPADAGRARAVRGPATGTASRSGSLALAARALASPRWAWPSARSRARCGRRRCWRYARRCRSPSWRWCPPARCRPALYDVMRAISALFPFKPTLDALDAALNDSGGIGGPLLHLAALFVGLRGGAAGWRCGASRRTASARAPAPSAVVSSRRKTSVGERVDAVQEQQAVEVVDLVEQAAGLEALALDLHRSPCRGERLDLDRRSRGGRWR